MKTLSVILLSLFVSLFVATDINAQKQIKFVKGKSSTKIKLNFPAGKRQKYVLYTGKKQIINVNLIGDIYKTKPFKYSVVNAGLINGKDNIDNWQDGTGYLSIYTGRKGKYIFEVENSDKRSRTFTMEVSVTNDINDYNGGISISDDVSSLEETEIKFAKGRSFKTMKVTIPAGISKKFFLYTGSEQVINVDVSGNIYLENSNNVASIPAIKVGLLNGKSNLDNWGDGNDYLSVFTGRKGKYILVVFNSSDNAKTFTMKVKVTNDFDDYRGEVISK